MKRPDDLIVGTFIAVSYEKDGELVYGVAYTYQCYEQTWKQALMFKGGDPTHVDAEMLGGRYFTKVDWDKVLSWVYVDTSELWDKVPQEYKIKYGIK